MSQGVWIAGPTRSGTNMTAGAFAACGVFFGACGAAGPHNKKGLLENIWLYEHLLSRRADADPHWPQSFYDQLQREGRRGDQPWGAKCSPHRWELMRRLEPAAIVLCQRPACDVLDSRRRAGFRQTAKIDLVEKQQRWMARIEAEADVPVTRVYTDLLVAGDYSGLAVAFDAINVPLDEAAIRQWIDPSLWKGGQP